MSFNKFIEEGKVRKTTPNKNLQESLIKDAENRFKIYYKDKDDENKSKYVFENLYEALSEKEANIFDKMRRLRNSSKYYGKEISFEKLQEQLPNFLLIKKILQNK